MFGGNRCGGAFSLVIAQGANERCSWKWRLVFRTEFVEWARNHLAPQREKHAARIRGRDSGSGVIFAIVLESTLHHSVTPTDLLQGFFDSVHQLRFRHRADDLFLHRTTL